MVLRIGNSSLHSSIGFAINQAFDRLAGVSLKLSTMKRINHGSDDPAGLIAAEHLSSEIAAYQSAIDSAERTRAWTRVADGAMANVGGLLNDIQAKLVAAADDSLSPEAKEAVQFEIDAALDAVNRLGATTFGDKPVFGTTSQFLAGPNPTDTETLDLPAIDASLGGAAGVLADLRSGGSASIQSDNLETSWNIVEQARSLVQAARAEVGAFDKYVVDSTERILQDTQINLAGALSAIRDADVAQEASHLSREMILAETSVATSRLFLKSQYSALSLVMSIFDQHA